MNYYYFYCVFVSCLKSKASFQDPYGSIFVLLTLGIQLPGINGLSP